MAVTDLFVDGIKSGWNVTNASRLEADLTVAADVAIIGTGAGGGTSAEILAQAGLKVIMLEHGPLKSSNDFNMNEREAYVNLYQESAARQNKSGSITVLQGRAVGGSTTVNWSSCFRTPEQTQAFWTDHFEVKGFSAEEMTPWFNKMETRLNIGPWLIKNNANNDILREGCERLGYSWGVISRNVKDCWDIGSCGFGCPTNAKQSMLVTTIPGALKKNAELIFLCRANKLIFAKSRINALQCFAMMPDGSHPTGIKVNVMAKHYILAGGAINSPALLMHSNVPDPYKLLGKRTFIHPVVGSMANFKEPINAFAGAPQSVYSDHFQWQHNHSGPMGFKLEALPLHPALTAALLRVKGKELSERMKRYRYTNCLLALLRDGFHKESPEGQVVLRSDGTGIVDYEMSEYAWEGVRRALLTQANIQFAAGATDVTIMHQESQKTKSLAEARHLINSIQMRPFATRVGTAHLMGGNPMSENPKKGVVNSLGEHHQLENLSVIDGSVFPTSIGANPQLSIYAVAAKFADNIIGRYAHFYKGVGS